MALGRLDASAGTNATNTTMARPNSTNDFRVRSLRMVFSRSL
jgi:hypothetical protein